MNVDMLEDGPSLFIVVENISSPPPLLSYYENAKV